MDWKKLIGLKAPGIPDLEAMLAALQADKNAAESEASSLAAGRRAVLRDGSDDALRKHDERAAAAARRRDRADVAIEEVTAKLETARAGAAEAARQTRYDQAAAQVEKAAQAIDTVYPEAVATLRALLRQIAEAELAAAAANADLPVGADRLGSPEAFRVGRGPGERVLSTERLELWCDAAGKPLPPHMQKSVARSSSGLGYIPREVDGEHLTGLRKLAVVATTYIPAPRFRFVDRLAEGIALPAERPGALEAWTPIKSNGWQPDYLARAALAQLATLEQSRPEPKPEPVVRYELVDPGALYRRPDELEAVR